MKNKKCYKSNRVNKIICFDNKVNSLIDSLIPAIIMLVPIVFLLYILNIHGYIFPKTTVLFHLNVVYKYFMYILVSIYIYKVIIKKVSLTKSDVFLLIFMFFTILSTFFAYNRDVALFGYPQRYEGMYTLLFYIFLYLDCKLLSKDNDINFLIRMMLGVSFVHFILVILQLTGLYQILIYMYKSGDAIGLTENCNFLGSLMCLFSTISLGGYLLYEKNQKSIYYLIVFLVSYITLLYVNCSGPYISFIITFIFLTICLSVKKLVNLKKIVFTLIIIIFLYPVCLYKNDKIIPEITSNLNTVINLIFAKEKNDNTNNENFNEIDGINSSIRNLGHGRIRIWSNVLDLIKDKPLLGYGPDNLGLVYKKSIDDTKIADKAHNIYLHIFVSSGVFAFLSYILWVCYTIYLGLKSNCVTVLILCFGIIAYSIQGLFNINVLEVTPYFYLTMGFMMYLINEKKISFNK